jgi:hypothetical protein
VRRSKRRTRFVKLKSSIVVTKQIVIQPANFAPRSSLFGQPQVGFVSNVVIQISGSNIAGLALFRSERRTNEIDGRARS